MSLSYTLCEQIYLRNPRCTSPRASGVVLPVSAVMRSAISFCYQRKKFTLVSNKFAQGNHNIIPYF